MLINFHSAFSENEERAAEYIESIERPLLVVNKELILIARNSKAAELFPELPVGSGLYTLFGKNARTASELMPYQVLCAELYLFGTPCAVTVIGGSERLLVLFDSVETRIDKTVFDACGKMSGYDLKLAYPKHISDDETPVLTKGLLGDNAGFLFRVLNERNEARDLSPFNAGAVFSAVIDEFGADNFAVLTKTADVNALGSMRDLAVVTAYMLSFFGRNPGGEKAEIKTETDHFSVCFSVKGKTGISEEDAKLIFSERPVKTKLSDPADEERFWLYLIRLLTETNLWNLETEFNNGRALFRLTLPAAEQDAFCVLRDKVLDSAKKAVMLFKTK